MFRIAFILTALVGVSTSARGADLEGALLDRAKGLVKHCQQSGYRTIGVLKFLGVKEGGDLSDNLGTINTLLARRLEIAFVLANDPRNPIGVIDEASTVAARTSGASHRTPEGRRALLAAQYKLAWGDPRTRVTPDAFLTGLVGVSKDLKTLTISFLYFDRKTNELEAVPGIPDAVVANRPAALVELGESFTVRGAFDDGKVETKAKAKGKNDPPADLPKDKDPAQAALQSAVDVRDQTATKHPAEDPNAPIKLTVLYDGKPVKVEVLGGKAFIPEPATGQRVEFVIAKDAKAQRYGVVLKVNGENTLDKQRLPDVRCRKWIMTDPGESVTIRGYQLGTDRIETFRVLSTPESKAREVNYGADVGTLTLTVFPDGKTPAPDLADDAAEKTAVAAAELPVEPSKSFDSLKAKLLADANRGLIVEGTQVAGKVQVVKFTPAASPVMTLTVIYYKK
ncbi:MAG TPA: hypothetical protein VHR66_07590 [Gemmataceae bacterium]|jgi:hypothetical protein|nr:hypothetical protein [Gemmataceae bacterium]